VGKPLEEWAENQPANDPELARLARELERIRLERNVARAAHRQAERDVEQLQADVERLTALDAVSVETAKWAKSKRRHGKNEATALIMLSDLHLDEVIDPAEVAGMNAYNREIALQRLQQAADGAIRLGTELLAGFDIRNAVVVFGGDMVHGNLHDNAEWNETPSVIATVDYWADHLAKFLDTISNGFGGTEPANVHCVSVVGNHGRNTMKPRTRGRVIDSFDHHLTRLVQRHYRDDPRFSWNVPMSADAYVNVYDTRILVTHGDQARGGSGISGLFTPVALLDSRKRKRDASFGRAYDHLMMGHWHTYVRGNGFTINGSLCGVNAYAYINNFGYEPPAQAFGIITPEHGVTIEAPIYCSDRKREGW
jgi:hypothetical protein